MEQIGKYKITALIGRGGFGRVYRAYDPTVGREVAIKVLAGDAGDEHEEMLARFRIEANAAGGLQHKNIVTIFEYGEHQGSPYLVMEFLDGRDLHNVLKDGQALTLVDKLSIMAQVAEGLNHAHVHGIIHRDVKPANVMVLKDGGVKIMDFGIARLTRERGTRLTQTGTLMGTVPYMAPEQFAGGTVDHLTDIFAYGVILYEVLTGTHPFRPPNAGMTQVMFNIGTLDPPPISSLMPGCPAQLDQVVAKLLNKEPDQRPQSLEDVLIDLHPIQMVIQAEFAEQHLARASELLEAGQVDEARSIIRSVLRRDPSNRTARELRESIQGYSKKQSRERARNLAETGRKEIEAGNYPEAIRLLEEARRLDTTNTEASGWLQHAREAADLHRRAQNLLSEAKVKYAADDLSGAYRFAMESLALIPGSEAATSLVETIRRELEERDRRRKLREDADRVQELIAAGRFDEALSILDQLRTVYRDSRTLRQLQLEVREKQNQQRREQVQREVAQAQQAVSEGRLDDALQMIARWPDDDSQLPEVRSLRAQVQEQIDAKKKADRIGKALNRAESLATAGQFEKARGQMKQALETDPSEPALLAMIERIDSAERDEGVRSALRQGEQFAASQQFQAAVDCLDRAIARWGHEELVAARARIDKERQRHERTLDVDAAAGSARQLLDQDNPQAAVDRLRSALAAHPGERRLTALLRAAEAQLEAKKQDDQIAAITGQAESLLAARAFAQALEILEQGRRQFPEARELERLRKKIEEAHVAACRADVRALLDGSRFQEAIRAADAALQLFPADTALQEMRAAAAAGRAEQQRAQAKSSALRQAYLAQGAGNVEEAISILEKQERESGSSADLLAALTLFRQERAEQQRQAAVARMLDRARKFAAAHDFDGAINAVQQGLKEYPGNPDLGILLEEMQLAQFEHEQNEAAGRATAVVEEAAAKKDWQRAEETLQLTLRDFPENSRLNQKLEEVRRLRRQSELEAIRAEIESLCAAGRLEDAAHRARTAMRDYAGDAGLGELAARIEQELRRREVHRRLDEARALLDGGDAEAAAQRLEQARSEFPGEPELTRLLEFANATIDARRRASFIDDAIGRAHSLMENSEPEQAAALLEAGLRRYPDANELAEALRTAHDQVAARKREAEVALALSNARTLAAQSRLSDAVSELRRALTRYPGDAGLERALRETEDEKARFDREAAINAACSQADRALTQGKAEDALSTLAAALSKFPGEPALLEVQTRAERLYGEQEQAQVRLRDLQALRKLPKAAKSARTLSELDTVQESANTFRDRYRDDSEFRTAGSSVDSVIMERRSKLTPAVPRERVVAAGEDNRKKYLVAGAVAAGAVIVVLGLWWHFRTPGAESGVVVSTNPAGATIRIGSETCSAPECKFELGDGTYELDASLEGHRSVKRRLALTGARSPIRIDLEPLPTRVVISTNLETGSVLVDGRPAGALRQGKFSIEPVAAGKHNIEIRGTGKEIANVEFEVIPGRAPSLTRPAVSSEVQVLAIGRLGKRAGLISDGKPKTVATANRPLGTLTNAPTPVEELPEGTVEIILQEGSRSWTYALQPSAAPTVAIFVSANRDIGVLLVETGVPGAEILVDGRVVGQTGESGNFEIALRTGAYRVSSSRSGYEAAPATRVEIERDSVRRTSFRLIPRGAVLALVGALPDTEVLIDGRRVETVSGNRSLSVSPGQHSIELKKDGYAPVRFSRQFNPGSTVTLGPGEITLAEIPKPRPDLPVDPPPPDPRIVEVQRWEVAQSSNDANALEQFRRDFPSSPRAAEAAKRIEQLEWDSARKRNDLAALQAFLAKYPSSAHRAEAEQTIAKIAWEKVDRNNLEALRAYAKQYPQYGQQAVVEIERLQQERLKTDLAAIQQTLTRLTQAFSRKDFQEVSSLWPSVPNGYRDTFRNARSIGLQIRPTSPPRITGDSASLTCDWVYSARFQDDSPTATRRATINFVRNSTGWGIESVQ